MPVPIRLLGANGQQLDVVLNNTTNNQTFFKTVPFLVTSVVFDPEKQLISKNNQTTLGAEDFELNSDAIVS